MQYCSEDLFKFDKNFNKIIIGTDEAGRGPGAGGVFAAAVHFNKVTKGLVKDLETLNDSKKLTSKKRDSIFDIIKNEIIRCFIVIHFIVLRYYIIIFPIFNVIRL